MGKMDIFNSNPNKTDIEMALDLIESYITVPNSEVGDIFITALEIIKKYLQQNKDQLNVMYKFGKINNDLRLKIDKEMDAKETSSSKQKKSLDESNRLKEYLLKISKQHPPDKTLQKPFNKLITNSLNRSISSKKEMVDRYEYRVVRVIKEVNILLIDINKLIKDIQT